MNRSNACARTGSTGAATRGRQVARVSGARPVHAVGGERRGLAGGHHSFAYMPGMGKEEPPELLRIAGQQVRVTHPSKLYFSGDVRATKLDLVRYFLAVSEGALLPIRGRPVVLKRFVDGAERPAFFQKRAPNNRPPWIRTVELSFPSGRVANEVVIEDAAGLAWLVNLGCIELHPHPVRAGDLEHPDELRIDLDPGPGVAWADVCRVALEVKAFLEEMGLVGWPKTSGSRGMHVLVRILPRWTFGEVRRGALAISRAIERRVPTLATSRWWKEERHGVFLDYNQNAKDRTTCSAYSVRPVPDARVSMPLHWHEVPDCNPADFNLLTAPRRFREIGDPHAGLDGSAGILDKLLELSARDEASGLGDAPWPPHFRKAPGEPERVAPSRRSPARSSRPRMPLVVVARSPDKAAALEGLERWKQRHPGAAQHLAVDDVLVDAMRGRFSIWTRVRVNLRHVPEALRPAPEPPDPDQDPTR